MEKEFALQGKAKSEDAAGHEQLAESGDVDMRVPSDEVKADASSPCQEQQTLGSSQARSAAVPEFLSKKFAIIERGLDDYCENATAVSFMQIYTCIYDLCNGREHKNAVCRAVYELYRRETQLSVQQLSTACQRLSAAPPASLQQLSSEVLLEWRRLERRFHALQASFGYLDRYFVPRASLEPLSALRLSTLQAEGLEEQAQKMWNVLAISLRDGYAAMSFQRMQQLAEAWGTLTHVVGMEEAAAATGASRALREHLAATFTEGRKPLGRPGTVSGMATDRVLGMQRPLVREIIEFLSEQDLCQVYDVRSLQRSA